MKVLNKCDKNNMEWTVRRLINNYESGLISFDNAIQRGFVWKKDRQSEFIKSVILEKPIPPIYVTRDEDGNYSAIDGKQRCMTLIRYMNDEFLLEGLDPIPVENDNGEFEEFDLNGFAFSGLPSDLQDAIKDPALTFVVINQPTDEEVCDYFYLLNNGMPLNAITKTRVKAKSREDIMELGQHELFKNSLTEKAFERYANEDIVVKAWAVLNQEEPSLDTKNIRRILADLDISSDDKMQLIECFDRILEVHDLIEDKKIARRLVTKTHLLSIMRVVWDSIENGLSAEQFSEWFVSFFCGKKSPTNNSVYNSCAGAGSARKDAVCKRLNEVWKHYKAYFSGNLGTYSSENVA